MVFGVNGAQYSSPFDANASLPAFTHGEGVTSLSQTISTTNANTMLIGFLRFSGTTGFGTMTPPSGFSSLISAGSFAYIATKTVSSAQSSVAENFSWTTSGSNNTTTGYLFDAIQASTGGSSSGNIQSSTGF